MSFSPMTRRQIATVLLAILPACEKSPHLSKQESADVPTHEVVGYVTKGAPTAESEQVAALIDPEKLRKLKTRGTNPRILKITGILYVAKSSGKSPETIVTDAIQQIGWGGTEKGHLTAVAMTRNLDILERLGSTTPEDLAELRRGRSPIVRKGPYVGEIVSVDHIIPRAVAPELDNVIANLELMPLRLNQSKNDKIGDRQKDLAGKLHAAGLLAEPGKVR